MQDSPPTGWSTPGHASPWQHPPAGPAYSLQLQSAAGSPGGYFKSCPTIQNPCHPPLKLWCTANTALWLGLGNNSPQRTSNVGRPREQSPLWTSQQCFCIKVGHLSQYIPTPKVNVSLRWPFTSFHKCSLLIQCIYQIKFVFKRQSVIFFSSSLAYEVVAISLPHCVQFCVCQRCLF